MRGLGRYYELTISYQGEIDPATGYLHNVKGIDEAVRVYVLPYLEQCLAQAAPGTGVPLGSILQESLILLQEPLGRHVQGLHLLLTPTYGIELWKQNMEQVIIRQQFEFAAAHRLHASSLSDGENRQLFGKCNNPAGHGHNYRLEVAVRTPIDREGHVLTVQQLDDLVGRTVIDRLDHKHLNHDVSQFRHLNPSVENIAKVIWDMLVNKLDGLDKDSKPGSDLCQLEWISVWETDKTVCTYRGP